MKKPLRIFWNLLVGTSALLCVAMIVWWIAGENNLVTLRPYVDEDSWALTLASSLGRCVVQYGPIGPLMQKPDRVEFVLTFDCWKAVVALAVLPGVWIGLFFQRKHEAKLPHEDTGEFPSAPKPRGTLQSSFPTKALVTSTLLVFTLLLLLVTFVSHRDYEFSAGPVNFSAPNGTLFFRYFPDRAAVTGQFLGAYGYVFFGFQAYRMKYFYASNYTLVIPDWAIAAVLALILWLQLRPWRKARRARLRTASGLCPTCGYNLTDNVSGVCPECGSKLPS